MSQINEYFDYIWGDEQYSIEEHFMSDLPQCIRSDILLCKYAEAIENSIIFKDDSGAIDVSLSISLLKLMDVRTYMTNEFIFKCGQEIHETHIVLEGQAVLVGSYDLTKHDPESNMKRIEEKQIIGVCKMGSHFGNDLPNQAYNYNNKTICHLVARQPSVVGVINKNKLLQIYQSFPAWKTKI